MDIDREVEQGNIEDATERVTYCLDQLEKADDFINRIYWDTEVVPNLTIEEMIGALISAEQEITKLEEKIEESD
jgi:hypothetical protein